MHKQVSYTITEQVPDSVTDQELRQRADAVWSASHAVLKPNVGVRIEVTEWTPSTRVITNSIFGAKGGQ